MVSHDRAFLNNAATSTIVFEGHARFREYVCGYDDWLRQRPRAPEPAKASSHQGEKPKKERPPQEKRRLSYKETREREELPRIIEALEEEQRLLMQTVNDPAFYAANDAAKIRAASERLEALEKKHAEAYRRWEELETMAEVFGR